MVPVTQELLCLHCLRPPLTPLPPPRFHGLTALPAPASGSQLSCHGACPSLRHLSLLPHSLSRVICTLMCLLLALSVCMPLSPQCLEGGPVQDGRLKPIQDVPLTCRLKSTKVPSAPDFPQTVGSPYSALPTRPFQMATPHWATPWAPNLALPSTASSLACCQQCPSLPPLGQCGNYFYAQLSYAFSHSCPSRLVASALFRATQAPPPPK